MAGLGLISPVPTGTSVPVPGAGDAGKVVTVNGTEDGYELDTPTAGPGGGGGTWPRDLAVFALDNTGAVTGLKVWDAEGGHTDVVAGGATGLPWLLYADDGSIYVSSSAHIGLDATVGRSAASDAVVQVSTSGWGGLQGYVPQSPGGPTLSIDILGSLDGTPSAWENGGPTGEPGWDLLFFSINGGSIQGGSLRLNLL